MTERAEIVAWLRGLARAAKKMSQEEAYGLRFRWEEQLHSRVLDMIASRIERGEHQHKETNDGE